MAILRANNNTLSSVTALPDAISTGGLVHLYGVTSSNVTQVDVLSTANGGVLDFSKYKRYMIRIAGIKTHDSTSSSSPQLRVFNSNTIQTTAGHYKYTGYRIRANGGHVDTPVTHTADMIPFVVSNYQNSTGMSSTCDVWVDFSAYYFYMYSHFISYGNTNLNYVQSGHMAGGYYGASTNTVDGLRFFMSSGNVTGRIDVFGMLNTLGNEVG